MTRRIEWTTPARADVRRLDRQTAMMVLEGLADYVLNGSGNVERLKGVEPPELRLRVGDYRVRFWDHGDWIEILRVRHRSEAYR
ncbi:MAG TPA: type II toxin-antitoxin system RelE/ParE family toxin [Bryobacteraceae bacterium]|nr:type II toxin-antitoxin system RelE/ParE family toxin [Bryobacteraceae bacterium]